jgi:hypothetical protein
MKTGSWFTTKTALGRVGISLGTPRGMPGGYRLFKALAPTKDMLSMSDAQYEPRFVEILQQLNPQATWDKLHEMAGGHDPVILCFEKPGEVCHRRWVAKWFEATLGHVVPEYGFDGPLCQMTPAGELAFTRAFGSRTIRAE